MTTTPEHGTLTHQSDPGSLECVCGNTTNDSGFIPCSPEGVPAWQHATPKPEGLADHSPHALCTPCGRVYNTERIQATGTAAVITRADMTTREFRHALAVYLAT